MFAYLLRSRCLVYMLDDRDCKSNLTFERMGVGGNWQVIK